MGYTDMKEWLDVQIAWREVGMSLKAFDDEIEVIDIPREKRIHLWNVKMAADVMGMELQEEKDLEEDKIMYFMYRGYKIHGYEVKKL